MINFGKSNGILCICSPIALADSYIHEHHLKYDENILEYPVIEPIICIKIE